MTKKWDKERHTSPAINQMFGSTYSAEYFQRELDNRLRLRMNGEERTEVQWHKDVFGPQSYCYFNGEFRFWVWDFDDWRIWVNNVKGSIVEVDPSFDAEQTLFTLRYYWDKMGL